MSVNHNTLVNIPATISSTVSSHTWTLIAAQSGQSANTDYDGTSQLVYSVHLTDRSIKFQAGTWSDYNPNLIPSQVLYNSTNGFVELGAVGNNQQYGAFTSPFFSSGPTVTSHTAGIVITNDTIADTDFTWLKDGNTYSPTNLTLTASTTIGANNETGYYYDDFENTTAIYTTTIDSKAVSALYVDIGWTIGNIASSSRTANSNRILNVLATIPSYITIGSGSDLNGNPNPLTTVFSYNGRVIQHTQTATINGVTGNIYINFVINNKVINGVSEIVATFYETRTIGTDSSFQSNSVDYIIGAQQTMTYTQSFLGDTINYYVSDWVYEDEPEGDGYIAPVTTTSNGGGKRRRYPIISTNLFDRQKSIYSIGLTHKDETLF